jgi:hypothetical protein
MKFREIASRLTGFSVPIFGVSWNPPVSHITVARRVIRFLEDRRVLYNPNQMEDLRHCIQSVIEIRHLLTSELSGLTEDEGLPQNLHAMRAACRKFLDTVQDPGQKVIPYENYANEVKGWVFRRALGEMRGVIGIHVAALATQYGIDVEGELESILPASDDQRDA